MLNDGIGLRKRYSEVPLVRVCLNEEMKSIRGKEKGSESKCVRGRRGPVLLRATLLHLIGLFHAYSVLLLLLKWLRVSVHLLRCIRDKPTVIFLKANYSFISETAPLCWLLRVAWSPPCQHPLGHPGWHPCYQ